ncbi:MAG: hypothetical protein KA015_05275 [Spirochaetes bacterium]|nr:hypothetical protein [Spirochaetota bacterium]
MVTRRELVLIITKRLIILTMISLFAVGGILAIPLFTDARIMFSWLCLLCGIIGGFVSIQQRLKKITDEELRLLSGSWFQVSLIPIYGGIFAFVIYLIFLSGFISSAVFPEFAYPPIKETGIDSDYFIVFLRDTVPKTGQDFTKLLFWCFVAGFSERFVPQIINEIQEIVSEEKSDKD